MKQASHVCRRTNINIRQKPIEPGAIRNRPVGDIALNHADIDRVWMNRRVLVDERVSP